MKTIYVLIDPRPPMDTVYIGCTSQPLINRWRYHLSKLSSHGCSSRKDDWVRSLLRAYVFPICRSIETVEDIEGPFRERYWVRYYCDMGLKVVNTVWLPHEYKQQHHIRRNQK